MKERPILFNSDMVKAILDGRKTQTRRAMKVQPSEKHCTFANYKTDLGYPASKNNFWAGFWMHERAEKEGCSPGYFKSPYGVPGDRLYVRETFAIECNLGFEDVYTEPVKPLGPVIIQDGEPGDSDYFACARYRASEPETELAISPDGEMKWSPSIHMPKKFARIWLEITDIRVERVRDISQEDAKAEGVRKEQVCTCGHGCQPDHLIPFQQLWDSIYKNWADNPWVWVVEFKKINHP